ncbi:NADH-quinone oxidoreductase subunit L [Aestuariispira insulae]|uniref:NADH dehydrogenase subunit L n=1 Tax=Aestuariispira insulae TaxID=1461337 RepID=A0A3D9HV53_9PROT|nr:NADH-quinone oxidoreductase subunit L [Aestuariispira insulae]RED53319.1 NADH dehydrogenase subunit L [Aestuariispira insulae]
MTQVYFIVFLPLLAAIIAGFFGRQLGDRGAHLVTCSSIVVAAVLSWYTFLSMTLGDLEPAVVPVFTWISSGEFSLNWALNVDALTATMLIVVTTVSAVVHIYSVGYMHHDKSQPRFMAYLSFFSFSMLMLVTADNLVQMFFGWEGVGVASYLLIGFWYHKPSANAAAIKAFIVNRVGDLGFALGIFLVFVATGSVLFEDIFPAIPGLVGESYSFLGLELDMITTMCILLFIGAMGKSAQLGLHTWLPDAMEGPTPVSALIHAATMVTAGVFMVCRLSPIFEYSEFALMVVTVVGASTAFFAATVGLTQNDIKRVIAYSTCSQLGYMFFAAGVSAYQAAMFHLMTHAFFKALLFLGAGSVIHAMSDEQDMRNMGGLAGKIKLTYAFMMIGSIALMGFGVPGVFGFAGFYSKDFILEAAWAADTAVSDYALWLGIIAAFMTAFYSGRLLFMTFHGKPRCDEKTLAHVHESPLIMTGPLWILAIGAVLAGIVGYPYFVGHHMAEFWGDAILVLPAHDIFEKAHHPEFWVIATPLAAGLSGFALSFVFYVLNPALPGIVARTFKPLYAMSYNKWYFDEIFDFLFVKPAFCIGRIFWKKGDQGTIDHFGPDGVAARTRDGARLASLMQSGYVYHYAFAMLIGVVLFATWYILSGAA